MTRLFNVDVGHSSGVDRAENAPAVQKRVDEALRRWRHSGIPVDDSASVGDRRARAISAIAAAMRQGRLERDQLKGRRRWGYVLSAAGVLLVLGGGVALTGLIGNSRSTQSALVDTQATLTGQAGRIWVGSTSAEELVKRAPLKLGARHRLEVGERIVTQGNAALEVGTDTQVQLREDSELLLLKNAFDEGRIKLNTGHIKVSVTPKAFGAWQQHGTLPRAVVVETPDASVVVHGTRFSVSVASGTTRVSVTEGVVAVLQEGIEQARLRAGQTWSSDTMAQASEPDTAATSEASRADMDSPSAPLADDDAPGAVAKAGKRASSTWGKPRQRPVAQRANDEVRPEARSPGAGSPAEIELASSTLMQENMLFRAAVDARNAGDDARSVRFFDQLLAKYPKSALLQEARVERFRALKRLGRDREAAKEARRYLIEHSDGFAEDEARDVALTPGD